MAGVALSLVAYKRECFWDFSPKLDVYAGATITTIFVNGVLDNSLSANDYDCGNKSDCSQRTVIIKNANLFNPIIE